MKYLNELTAARTVNEIIDIATKEIKEFGGTGMQVYFKHGKQKGSQSGFSPLFQGWLGSLTKKSQYSQFLAWAKAAPGSSFHEEKSIDQEALIIPSDSFMLLCYIKNDANEKQLFKLEFFSELIIYYIEQLLTFSTLYRSIKSQKSIRVLEAMVNKDLTLKQASSECCISLDTGNKHIYYLKRKLGINRLSRLVAVVVKEGLIEVDPKPEADIKKAPY